ncbi:hypothetical protein AE02_01356, partial [Klebsiella variicola]
MRSSLTCAPRTHCWPVVGSIVGLPW